MTPKGRSVVGRLMRQFSHTVVDAPAELTIWLNDDGTARVQVDILGGLANLNIEIDHLVRVRFKTKDDSADEERIRTRYQR